MTGKCLGLIVRVEFADSEMHPDAQYVLIFDTIVRGQNSRAAISLVMDVVEAYLASIGFSAKTP